MTTLKIMTFNILSDAPIWKKKWAHVEKKPFILWDYRKKLIMNILKDNDPDICLLCEVEYEQVLHFSKYCYKNNYNYVYASTEPPKSTETKAGYANNYTNAKNPGILIMFKSNKIRIINNYSLDYENGIIRYVRDNKMSDDIINYFLKPCVSNIVLFEKLDDDKRFYFVGLHHYNNPKEEDVKEFEITLLLGKLFYKNSIHNYPIIICGDFNAVPTSKVYEIITKKNKLNSAYKLFTGSDAKLTVSVPHFKDTLDYIFVNDLCKVINMKLIDEDYLMKNEIPNENYPSDHMYLVADIEIL